MKIFRIVIFTILTALFMISGVHGQQKKQTAAVLEFVSADLSKNEVTNLTNRFRNLMSQTNAFDMIERDKMKDILKEQDFTMTESCNSAECAVQIGQLLGVEVMIAGDIGKMGQMYTIDLRMVDVSTGKILLTKSEDYKGDIEGLLTVMKLIANDFAGIKTEGRSKGAIIVAGQESFGTAVFKLPVEGATPVINGIAGNPVFSKDIKLNLPAGVHKIKFTKSGYAATQEFSIQIKENEETSQTVELKEDKTATAGADLSLNFGIVSITTSPAGAKLLDGDIEVGTTPLSGLKLSVGSHTLTLKKSKYHTQAFTVDIKDGINRIPEKTLAPNFGTLKITSVPSGAKVKINGMLKQGATPLTFDEFQSGYYEIEVERDRYFAEKKSAEVKDLQTAETAFTLKPQFADVTINSNPSGAKVYLDNQLLGTTPLVKKGEAEGILAGKYSLRLTMGSDLYIDYEDAITVKAGEPLTKTIDMKSNFGTIKIATIMTGFKVMVNGIENKEFSRDLQARLKPGNYEIEIIKDKHQPVKKTVSLADGATETIQAQFTAKQGRIMAYSVPDGADFILTDETGKEIYRGKSLDHQVLIGTYTVKTQMEGYGNIKTKTITVTEGYKEPLEFAFTDEDKMPSISITTDPSGADVYLDEKLVGKSPLTISKTTAGDHNIKAIMKSGGKELTGESRFTLRTGEFKNIDMKLVAKTFLTITTTPTGADITVDGQYIGKSPVTTNAVGEGNHQITATANKSGIEYTGENSFYLYAGETKKIDLQLKDARFGTFTDPRDGKTYKTVKIGNQVWMAENLNYDAGSGSWCYENSTSNCSKYGRLYDWATAKRVAPPGWHLPSESEFETLLRNLGGEGANAYQQIIPSGSSGFNALFGGWRGRNGNFGIVGSRANFWSSSEHDKDYAWHLDVLSNNQKAYLSSSSKSNGFSVRCIKD